MTECITRILLRTRQVKAKLEQTLDEMEDSLDREKKARQEVDKARRRVEGELKVVPFLVICSS